MNDTFKWIPIRNHSFYNFWPKRDRIVCTRIGGAITHKSKLKRDLSNLTRQSGSQAIREPFKIVLMIIRCGNSSKRRMNKQLQMETHLNIMHVLLWSIYLFIFAVYRGLFSTNPPGNSKNGSRKQNGI